VHLFWAFLALAAAWVPQTVQPETHFSQVMGANRTYRVFLPASYAASQKRYPVLYWFHGYESSREVDA
jgi:predicted peptidase